MKIQIIKKNLHDDDDDDDTNLYSLVAVRYHREVSKRKKIRQAIRNCSLKKIRLKSNQNHHASIHLSIHRSDQDIDGHYQTF